MSTLAKNSFSTLHTSTAKILLLGHFSFRFMKRRKAFFRMQWTSMRSYVLSCPYVLFMWCILKQNSAFWRHVSSFLQIFRCLNAYSECMQCMTNNTNITSIGHACNHRPSPYRIHRICPQTPTGLCSRARWWFTFPSPRSPKTWTATTKIQLCPCSGSLNFCK